MNNLPPETTSSVVSIISPSSSFTLPKLESNYDYNGYTGIHTTPPSLIDPGMASSINTMASTARFAPGEGFQHSTQTFGSPSGIRNDMDQYGINVISPS